MGNACYLIYIFPVEYVHFRSRRLASLFAAGSLMLLVS
jgi:hypothetical protein